MGFQVPRLPGEQDLLKPSHNLIPGVGQGILVRAANYKTKEFYFFDFLHIADLLWPITLVFPGADTNHFRLLVSAQNGPRSFLELLHHSIKLNQVFYITGDSLNIITVGFVQHLEISDGKSSEGVSEHP